MSITQIEWDIYNKYKSGVTQSELAEEYDIPMYKVDSICEDMEDLENFKERNPEGFELYEFVEFDKKIFNILMRSTMFRSKESLIQLYIKDPKLTELLKLRNFGPRSLSVIKTAINKALEVRKNQCGDNMEDITNSNKVKNNIERLLEMYENKATINIVAAFIDVAGMPDFSVDIFNKSWQYDNQHELIQYAFRPYPTGVLKHTRRGQIAMLYENGEDDDTDLSVAFTPCRSRMETQYGIISLYLDVFCIPNVTSKTFDAPLDFGFNAVLFCMDVYENGTRQLLPIEVRTFKHGNKQIPMFNKYSVCIQF